jgi:5-methylcytosine-specific restriction endonuclease McrA
MKRENRKTLYKKLDKLFSQYIRKRDGKCLKCSRTDTLQCAHIAGRRNLAGRWNEYNAITMCYTCHLRWSHQEPLEFAEWLKKEYPKFYETAKEVRRTTVKNLDLKELVNYYQSKYAEL